MQQIRKLFQKLFGHDRSMRLETKGEPTSLDEVEPGGLFRYGGSIALKTEYRSYPGVIDAFIVGTGERFWGGCENGQELNDLIVQPMRLRFYR